MAETINMPKLGFDMAEGLLVRWVKQVGENINKGDVLAEIETDKATVEVESSVSGVVLQLIVDQGTVVPVNAPIAVIGAAGEKVESKTVDSGPKTEARSSAAQPAPIKASAPSNVSQSETPSTVNGQPSTVKASPLAKKIARDNKVDLSHVQGTGPGGRIVRKDIEAALTADRRPQTVDRVGPSTVHCPLKTKSFKPPNFARPLDAASLSPSKPSRTSTSRTNSKWTRCW